jgi:hypothetical protein
MWYAAQAPNEWTFPPDPIGAAGLNSLIAVTNSQIEGIRKDGRVLFNATSLRDMFSAFSPRPNFVFDPKIIYDAHENRFVLVALEFAPLTGTPVSSYFYLAISKTSDPLSVGLSDWYEWRFDSFVEKRWADYPGIAVDEEAIYITFNMIGTVPPIDLKPMLWIIPKNPFYSGVAASYGRYDFLSGTSGFNGTHAPAMVRQPGGIAPGVGTYLVMYGTYGGVLANEQHDEAVQIVRINSPLNNPSFDVTWANIGDIESAYDDLNDAPQSGTSALIWTGDRRTLQAVWVKNQLWATMTASDGSQTAAYWLKFQANGIAAPNLLEKGKIDGENIRPGTFTAFPSLDVNSKGVAAFGFSAFSSSFYASAYATIRATNGTVFAPDLVRAGFGLYSGFVDTIGRNRWGDYTGTSLDPANEDCFWTFNEFAGPYFDGWGNGRFGMWLTAWARLCYSEPSCLNLGQRCSAVTECCAPANVCRGSPKTCQVCRSVGQRCSSVAECCAPANICEGPRGATTCQTCKAVGKPCLRYTQCCSPSNKVCEGPPRRAKTCSRCLPRNAVCARSTQCCRGYKCKNRRCLP